jgi:O-antigen/teichoic acid export membrane protein/cellulose synthase/poly-beta-1,6-N-acetylglucosamine synthase-like glycosyltransferase
MSVESVAKIIFWLSAAAFLYAYVGYPVLVALVARVRPRSTRRDETFLPRVTVIITAYNEERDLAAKLENTLALDYPKDLIEIVVASDCSADRTDEIAREFAARGVRLHRQAERRGKTATQNSAVELARGEIILFSDATTLYQSDVLRALLPNFADDSIGCVAGRLVYVDPSQSSVGQGARSYWGYETFLKRNESRASSLIGVSGCLYAVRRTAYVPLYEEACSDFIIATKMVEQDLRAIYEPLAVCTEETNRRTDKEMRMRVRVITQTFTDLWRHRAMLNPLRSGFYGVQLLSHKLLRYLVPVLLIAAFVSSLALAPRSLFFVIVFAAQIIFYAAAVVSLLLERAGIHSRLLALPQYFVLANAAALVACYKFARGERYARWEPIREPAQATTNETADDSSRETIVEATNQTTVETTNETMVEATAEVGAKKVLSLTAGAAWMMLARSFSFALAFAVPLLLVRRLSQTEFGLYKQIVLVVTTGVMILPLGVFMSAYYFLPRERARRPQVVFNILLFNLTVGLAACLPLILRPQLLAALLNNPELVALAPLVGIALLLWINSSTLEAVAVANQELKLATVFIIADQLVKAVLLLSSAILFGTVRAVVIAMIAHGAFQCALLFGYMRSRFGAFWRGFEFVTLRAQLAYALPLGVAAVVGGLYLYLDNYFVSYRFSPAEYAIYATGCFNIPLVDLLTASVNSVMIPRVSQLQSAGARREIVVLVARMTRKLAAFTLPLYFFLLVMAREFIVTLFTTNYLASLPIFVINITLIPLGLIGSAYDPVIRAYAEHRYFLLRVRVVLLTALAVALWYVTGNYGLIGAITVMLAVNATERLVVGWRVRRILGVAWRDLALLKDVGKIAVCSIVAASAAFALRTALYGIKPLFVLAACGALFAVVYFVALVALGVPATEEREAVLNRAARILRLAPARGAVDPLS